MRPFMQLHVESKENNKEKLWIDGVPVAEILGIAPTPVYVTSLNAIASRVKAYIHELSKYFQNNTVYYAVKANPSKTVLKEVFQAGAGADIVSIGEWKAVQRAGGNKKKVCFAGVGKSEEELREAIAAGIGAFNVEHIQELDFVLTHLTQHFKNRKKIVVAARLNPKIESKTHPYLMTGALSSKFGILLDELTSYLTEKKASLTQEEYLDFIEPFKGLHIHIGSQLQEPEVFRQVAQFVCDASEHLMNLGVTVTHLDLGGGLGVPLNGVPHDNSDIAAHVKVYADALKESVSAQLKSVWGEAFEKVHVSMEPGRSIVASASALLTEVLYMKKNSSEHQFLYVNAGMNDFPRPSLYAAEHAVDIIHTPRGKQDCWSGKWNVAGPICESGDILAQGISLNDVAVGSLLAFWEAGAYCRSMASFYNMRPIPGEVFVKNGAIVDVSSPILPPSF